MFPGRFSSGRWQLRRVSSDGSKGANQERILRNVSNRQFI